MYAAQRYHAPPPGITPAPTSTSNAGVLPEIPVPAGWEAQRVDPSRIDFIRQNTTLPLHARIVVTAFKSSNNIEEKIKSLGEDHSFDSSKTWNSVNGRLILANVTSEDSGTSFTYYVLGKHQLYVFTFLPYQFYNPETDGWVTPNPADLPVIKTMVESFAANAE